MFHLANDEFYFIFVEIGELLFVNQQNWVLTDFLFYVVLALFVEPNVVIDLFTRPHERLAHLVLNLCIVDFCQHHGVSCADLK